MRVSEDDDKQTKHAHEGMFCMFVVSKKKPNTKSTPMSRREGQVRGDGRAAEHKEQVPEDVFFVFGMRESKGGGGGGHMGAVSASRRWGALSN